MYPIPDFINDSEGYTALANNSDASVYYTNNGGESWTQVTPSDYWDLLLSNSN